MIFNTLRKKTLLTSAALISSLILAGCNITNKELQGNVKTSIVKTNKIASKSINNHQKIKNSTLITIITNFILFRLV